MQYKQLNINSKSKKPIILYWSWSGFIGFVLDNLYAAYSFNFQIVFDMISNGTFSPEGPLTSSINLREKSICWSFV